MNELPAWKVLVLLLVAVPVIVAVRYWKRKRALKNCTTHDELLAMGIAANSKSEVVK